MGTYHIRIRGSVLGPFRLERLQAMIQRGQLTRLHEVSNDGGEWRAAGDFPELFPPPPASSPAAGSEPQMTQVSPLVVESTTATRSEPSAVQWFYELNGKENGPAPLSELTQFIATGAVGPDNCVWREGMADWQPLRTTDLAVYLPRKSTPARSLRGSALPEDADGATLPPKTVQLLLDIRTWSGITAVLWIIGLGVFAFIYFVFLMSAPAAPHRVAALFGIIGCTIGIVPFVYVLTANASLGALRFTPSYTILDTALVRWRAYWIWYLVGTALLVAAILLLLIALPASMPYMR